MASGASAVRAQGVCVRVCVCACVLLGVHDALVRVLFSIPGCSGICCMLMP